MDSRTALTLSIGVLGGVAVAFTAAVITVPIWVVFLAISPLLVAVAVTIALSWLHGLACVSNRGGYLVAEA